MYLPLNKCFGLAADGVAAMARKKIRESFPYLNKKWEKIIYLSLHFSSRKFVKVETIMSVLYNCLNIIRKLK